MSAVSSTRHDGRADDVIAADGIPVAFHWVLALFLLVLAKAQRG